MSPGAIPAWTADGVLPPINLSQPVSPDRSPYVVSLTDYVLRFGTTAERRAVLDGYLRYRAALHSVGLVQGFQWLDGSFLEHVEVTERRAPNDIDVVTFFHLPTATSQAQLAAQESELFDNESVLATYRVDAYLVHLGMPPERLTQQSAYWYSVWSHRRNQRWKGFVQVDLTPTEDLAAAATLANPPPSSTGVRP
ncbi:MAG TPA: hypothetical protein VK539_06965 [Myxococcaceae bacterium]|nr:hypothetical protein [Myxococcaceae bacterium]